MTDERRNDEAGCATPSAPDDGSLTLVLLRTVCEQAGMLLDDLGLVPGSRRWQRLQPRARWLINEHTARLLARYAGRLPEDAITTNSSSVLRMTLFGIRVVMVGSHKQFEAQLQIEV